MSKLVVQTWDESSILSVQSLQMVHCPLHPPPL